MAITEESVTLTIVKWLREGGWEIFAMDYPQAGSGIVLHAADNNHAKRERLKEALIPDIIAHRDDTWVIFENKPRFYLPDFEKVEIARTTGKYDDSIEKVIGHRPTRLAFGIGLPDLPSARTKALTYRDKVDFIVVARPFDGCDIVYEREALLS